LATGGAGTAGEIRKGRSRGRRRIFLWVGLALFLLVVWAAYAGMQLLQARRDAQAGIDRLEELRSTMSADSLLAGDDLSVLDVAAARFASANEHATNPSLMPLRFLPVVGRQIRSVDDLTDAAEGVTSIAHDQVGKARSLVDTADVAPASRVALVTGLSGIARDAETALAAIDLGPDDGLLGPLDRARRRFADELDALHDTAQNVATAGTGLEELLQGPGRYLLLAANNSEMRVGSPSFLSVGVLNTQSGELELGEVRSVTNYPLAADAVPLTGDLADRWGWLLPNAEWRNLGSSPRFDANAELAAQMWQAATGETVDGVIALDLLALRALLVTTGPVEVEGKSITKDNVLRYLMREQYENVSSRADVIERREHLSDVAQAVLDRLDSGTWEVTTLVEQLTRAAEGRHLMLWSRDTEQQAGWEAIHVAGEVGPESLLLGLHNRSGNKLDQFLAVDAAVSARPEGDDTRVSVRVHARNETPEGLPQYVAGPFAGAVGAAEGRYQALLVLNLPPSAGDVQLEGTGERVAAGPDGGSQVIAAYVEADRGQEIDATISFLLPGDGGTVRVEPSSRWPEVRWTFADHAWDDHEARVIVISDHVT
jgi:Protein of unknown function (DUF4012)